MTQQETDAGALEIERVPTLVPGIDAILRGGFLSGGLYLIQGPPGIGKTILANQIIYNRAKRGSRALFVTVLGENHGRMMLHLRTMQFFDQSLMPDRVKYISAYQAFDDEGLNGLSNLLRREIMAHQATLLVVDDMSAVQARATATFETKRFTHELQTLASLTNCTMFLLTTASDDAQGVERTMVDGVIQLSQRAYGSRIERRFVVRKLRGSDYLQGEHAFAISRQGVAVFPRIEAVFRMAEIPELFSSSRLSFGIASLDRMFNGGIPVASMTAVMGASGAGKTTLALHFLSESSASEPGLLFGAYEPAARLRFKAGLMGFDLAAAEQRGEVEILWYPVGEHILDELAHTLLDAVRRRKVKRLVIDGMSVFQEAAVEPARIVRFWSTLSNELRALGVTTLYTVELQELAGPDFRPPVSGIASLGDVMILLRYVEVRARLYRMMSLLKVREGAFDTTIREFAISETGIGVGGPFEAMTPPPTGTAHEVIPDPVAGSQDRRRESRADDADRPG
ncbi:RAD55 family ATPase [Rhodopila sp.]|uniref:RAD55 family ATPase n=1 Tax=Rhodopila sp. TaxID=2480087 RepID=UPI003D14AE2D